MHSRNAVRVGMLLILALSVLTMFGAPVVANEECPNPEEADCGVDDDEEEREPYYDGPEPPTVNEVVDETIGDLPIPPEAPSL